MTPILLGGCIRLYASGPELHVNPAHVQLGLESVHVGEDGYLWIMHATSDPVVTILPVPDETLVGRGIRAGGSGGTGYTRVLLADAAGPLDLTDPVDYAKVEGANSNLWYAVVHAVSAGPDVDHLARTVGLLVAGAGWDFQRLALAYPSFDAARDAHATFDAMAVPR